MTEIADINKKGYKWVQDVLRERIVTGQWAVGFKLPSNNELCLEFDLNRLTINKSLVNLADQGLIVRRKGQGTFVADRTRREVGPRHLVKFISPQTAGGDVPVRHGVLEGMHEVLSGNGFHVGVNFYRTLDEEVELVRRDMDAYHAGFVVWCEPNGRLAEELKKLREEGYPFVLIDGYFSDFESDYVVTDSMAGSRAVVDYLVQRGHRQITYVTRPVDRSSLKDRQAGFIQGLVAHDLPIGEHSVVKLADGGIGSLTDLYAALEKILATPTRPTAIYFCNDDLALAAMDFLDARKIRVPKDISIVGYDNLDRSEYGPIPLTTVAQDWYKMGRKAAEVLLEKMGQKKPGHPMQVSLKPELMDRDTVRNILGC